MSCCGGNCSCGSNCGCGKGCTGCNTLPGLETDYSEMNTTSSTIILGVAPQKMFAEETEMGMGAEHGCKCGSNCTCDNCGCNN